MSASLRPFGGDARELLDLLEPWLREGGEPVVIRTSGSTGEPKDVVLSHAAVTASARATHERLGGPGQWLLALPTTGVAALQVLVRSIMAGERPVLADEHGSLEAALRSMDGARRYASLVPTQLHRLAEAGDLGLLAGLDALLVGGAATSPRLLARAREAGVTIVRTYGMSETSGGCVYDGLPLDGVRWRIGPEGRIQLAGATLFDGYADPEATARVLREGWLSTDDLGEADDDGRLRVLGRGDDVVVSGGVNIPLPAVTEALRGVDGVRDVQAVGVRDDEWGTRVVACIVGDVALDVLRDAVSSAGLPRTWAPRGVVRLATLPLLPGGKVDRRALRALAASS